MFGFEDHSDPVKKVLFTPKKDLHKSDPRIIDKVGIASYYYLNVSAIQVVTYNCTFTEIIIIIIIIKFNFTCS